MADPLILLTLSFLEQKFFILMKPSLAMISFIDFAFGVVSKKLSPRQKSSRVYPILSSRSLIVLCFTFRSVIHFGLIFVKESCTLSTFSVEALSLFFKKFILLKYSWFMTLISALQQSDSVIDIYFLFHILYHYGLLQDAEYSSLGYTVGPCCLSNLYILICICWSQTPNLSFPPPPHLGNHKSVLYVCESVSVS